MESKTKKTEMTEELVEEAKELLEEKGTNYPNVELFTSLHCLRLNLVGEMGVPDKRRLPYVREKTSNRNSGL